MDIKDHMINAQILYMRCFRLWKNLSSRQFANKIYVSESSISKLKSGNRQLSERMFQAFIQAFDIELVPFDEEILKQINQYVEDFIKLDLKYQDTLIEANPFSLSYPYELLARFIQSCMNKEFYKTENEQILLEKAVDLFPDSYQKIIYTFLGYVRTKNLPESVSLLKKSLEIEGDDGVHALASYFLSFRYKTRKELLAAIHYGEDALAYFKTNNLKKRLGKGYSAVAIAYSDNEDYQRAISYFEKTKEIIPEIDMIISYYFNLGYIYMEKEEFHKALAYFEKAKAIENDNLTCFYLAYCNYFLDHKKMVKKYIQEGRSVAKYQQLYDLFLDWIESMTKQRYSKKCLYYLQKIDKQYEALSYADKRFLNHLFIKHYEYLDDAVNQVFYLKRMQN